MTFLQTCPHCDCTMSIATYPVAQVEAMQARIAELEAKAKALDDQLADTEMERNAALAAIDAASAADARLAELDAQAEQAWDDEAWALDAAVTIHPVMGVESLAPASWSVRYWDGVRTLDESSPTIHAALRAIREKVEGGAK